METNGEFDYDRIKDLTRQLLEAIGEDPDREGLMDTPRRVAEFWREFMQYEPGRVETAFQSSVMDQVVVVSGMRVYSLCEHHLLPFWCDISIAYLPAEKVLGLSKFARIAHKFAHRLQMQERLVSNIAMEVSRLAETEDVAVMASGVHLCMVMRGISTYGVTTSNVMLGKFRESQGLRSEFLAIVREIS